MKTDNRLKIAAEWAEGVKRNSDSFAAGTNAAASVIMSMQWQSIESAPRDKKVLTLNKPNEVKHAQSIVKISWFKSVKDGEFLAPGLWMFDGAEGLSYETTHWMPLPPPPSEAK